MKKFKCVLLLITLAIFSTACMVTQTSVGAYKETQGVEYTYAKGKQFWILWGLVRLGKTNVKTPGDGNCEVVTMYGLDDFLIGSLTGGLVKSHSIKVKAKKQP